MLKNKLRKKSGRRFEEIVAWIQKSVHTNAIIKTNERIKDIDTGKLRQVDITIKLSDGPTEFFGIVEVRDRNRPIGVRYVEEISGKKRSVGADAAFLVSKSGFTKTAISKAKQISMRILSYEEAKSEDWGGWIRCRTFSVLQLTYENPLVTLFEYGTENKIICLLSKLMDIVIKEPMTKIITNNYGKPIISLVNLVNKIINLYNKKLHEDVPHDGSRIKSRIFYRGNFEPTLWVEDSIGLIRQIGNVKIELDIYFDKNEFPIKLMRYRKPDSPQSIAELATAEVEILGEKYIIEIIAPGAGENIPDCREIAVRTIKINDNFEQ